MSTSKRKAPLYINPIDLPDDALVDKFTRRALCGLGDSETYARIAAGTFPKQLKLGVRCARWRLGELRAWLADPMGWREGTK